jgi:phage terminase large subunit GpA-like protein
MTHLATWSQAFAAIVGPPPRPLAVGAFASRLVLPDGPDAGRAWRWHDHPGQRAVVEALEAAVSARRWRELVIVGPVQDGKTLSSVLLPVLYTASELRRPIVYGLPDRRLSGSLWRSKLKPAITGCGLGHLLPDYGPGSSTGSPDDVLLSTGTRLHLLGAGASNEAGQAGVTAWLVLLDENDAIRRRQAELIRQRCAAFGGDALTIISSTVKHDLQSPTLDAWEDSTAGSIQAPCLACGQYRILTWDQVTYQGETDLAVAASARLVCPACHAETDAEAHHQALTRALLVPRGQTVVDGRLIGDAPGGLICGIRWTSLDSPLRRLGDLARMHHAAAIALDRRGDHEPMRQFTRDHLVERYQIAGGDLPEIGENALALASAASPIERGRLPGWVKHVVMAVDCQKRRHYWLTMAIGDEGRVAIVDHGRDPICGDYEEPTPRQRHESLERLHRRACDGWPLPDGRTRPADRCAVDVNYLPDEILGWLAWRLDLWIAVRGVSEEQASRMALSPGALRWRLPGWLEIREQPGGWMLHSIDTDQVRGWLQTGILRQADAAEAVMLPRGEAADGELIRHLTAEIRRMTESGPVWVRRRARNDLLDTAVYAAAIGRALTHGERLLAQRPGETPTPATPQAAPARRNIFGT